MDHDTEAGVVADLTRRSLEPKVVTSDGRTWLVTPSGAAVLEVTDPNGLIPTLPIRTVQAVTLQTRDSLADYVERFKSADTLLFADIGSNTIVGAIDYHAAGQANYVKHRASLTLPYSVEWAAWMAIDGKLFAQKEFAQFLEENAPDIAVPTGAELLEVAKDMRAIKKADFRRIVRPGGEDESFEFTEESDARTKNGTIAVPRQFELSIPVYFGEPNVSLLAFLRWMLDDGQLLLGIKLYRPEQVRQAVFKEIVSDLAVRVERQAVFGKLA